MHPNANNAGAPAAPPPQAKRQKKLRSSDEKQPGEALVASTAEPSSAHNGKIELSIDDLRASVDVLTEDIVPKIDEILDIVRARKAVSDAESQRFTDVAQKLMEAQQFANTHATAMVDVIQQFSSIFASADRVTRKRFRRMMRNIERAAANSADSTDSTGRKVTLSYRAIFTAVVIAAILVVAYILGDSP